MSSPQDQRDAAKMAEALAPVAGRAATGSLVSECTDPAIFAPAELFDATATEHAALLEGVTLSWEILPRIAPYLKEHLRPGRGANVKIIGTPYIGEQVYLGEGTIVEPGVVIHGPAWIGARCHLRPGAYIRDHVIIGDGCVIGNSCEFKNAWLFNGCQVPHFSYVGDSILGAKAHLGAGVILSNFRLDGKNIKVRGVDTGLRKFGAMIGDGVEIGCHAVINPGSVLGRRAMIHPSVVIRGIVLAGHEVRAATAAGAHAPLIARKS